jgi:hypothetical protein
MIVVHDHGLARLTDETVAALATIAHIDQQQAPSYTIYRR